ncbi:MAG: cobalamin-dependent protein [Deltaproteobacteria bacterium]|nr:cobalamin-dependent protein [Deltaproteobacteria bacterium]MBW2396398.1 cobalamin-dependent protein [Deltaproteobacteria bacterium]
MSDATRALVEAIAEMREPEALTLAREMLDTGCDPLELLDSCRDAMDIVGRKFEEGEYFLVELLLAGEMLQQISAMARPLIQTDEPKDEDRSTIVLGTVQGDIHDIGKDIVTFMLDINGFEVIDLGVDVPVAKFIEAIGEAHPQVVGLSGFLTLSFNSMKQTIEAIEEAGLRQGLRIMIGGGQVDESIREFTGADAFGANAVAAVAIARQWTGAEG